MRDPERTRTVVGRRVTKTGGGGKSYCSQAYKA